MGFTFGFIVSYSLLFSLVETDTKTKKIILEHTTEVVTETTTTEQVTTSEPTTVKQMTTKAVTTKKAVAGSVSTTKAKPTKSKSTVTFKVTAYCACVKCCGKSDGITASGTKATQGRTIAADPRYYPYGTKIKLNGKTYIVEDCGGAIKGNRIDMYFDSHQDALQWGVRYVEGVVL